MWSCKITEMVSSYQWAGGQGETGQTSTNKRKRSAISRWKKRNFRGIDASFSGRWSCLVLPPTPPSGGITHGGIRCGPAGTKLQRQSTALLKKLTGIKNPKE